MRDISVVDPKGRLLSEISLPTPLLSVIREGASVAWGRLGLIRSLGEALLEADPQGADPSTLEGALAELQAGLLYAAVSGMRLRAGAPDGALPGLARLARRVDLAGPEGRGAILALWEPGVDLKTAVRAAEAGRYAHLILMRGSARLRPRLSVLVPGRDAERTLAELTELNALRVRAPVLLADPEQAPPAPRRARRRAPPAPAPVPVSARPVAPPEPPADTSWADPLLPHLTRGIVLSPPLAELDRAVSRLCAAIRPDTGPDLSRARILRLLIEAWRLGEGPGRLDTERFPYPTRGLHEMLRDRARAIELVIRGPERAGSLRAIARASALQAWALGAAPSERGAPVPDRRFREERSGPARAAPEGALELLSDLDGAAASGVLGPLVRDGLVTEGAPPALTERGRRLLEELSAPPDARLPSLLQLDPPTPEALIALSREGRVRRGRPALFEPDPEGAFGDLLTAAEGLVSTRPDEEADPLPEPLLDLLIRAWRVGKDRYRPPHPEVRVRADGEMGPYFRELARIISALTRPDRSCGEPGTALTLIRTALTEAWRIGAGPRPLRAPPVRFREECSLPLRPLSVHAREALIALHQEEEGGFHRGELGELQRAGLLLSAESRLLTAEGTSAALAELAHRHAPRPSLLDTIPAPEAPEPAPPAPAPPVPRPRPVKIPRRDRVALEQIAEEATRRQTRGRPPSSDPFPGKALRALLDAFALGRADPEGGVRAPKRVRAELERAVSDLAGRTGPDREAGGPEAARAPLLELCLWAYRLGAARDRG